ncbi:MAG: alkaline phosphatase [Sphaerochaetaceae bacterium]
MKTSFKQVFRILLASCLLFLLAVPVFAEGTIENQTNHANQTIVSEQIAKYVFLFIGDGMATPQINAAEAFANATQSNDVALQPVRFSQFPVVGLTTTYDAGSLITDSASAGTAIATGNKTLSGVVNMNTSKTVSYKTIAEYAREKGKKVGIVTTVSLDHATPACFYAKVPSRGNMYDIAVQLTESGFDYFGGGGFAQPNGKNKDQPEITALAVRKGYVYVDSTKEFKELQPGVGKVLAVNERLQDSAAMPYEIDRNPEELSLADYTAKGIELLSDDPDGFFMMVEGGKIDWACHANDAGAAILDTLAFDDAIAQAIDFANRHPNDTLIIVTGDHETGGMTIGFAGTKYATFFNEIAKQHMSFTAFDQEVLGPYKASLKTSGKKSALEDLLPVIKDSFGLDFQTLSAVQQDQLQSAFARSMGNEIVSVRPEDQYLLYGGYEPLTVKITQIINQQAGIGWTSYSHTGVPVATFAKGAAQELFGGYYDNTELFSKMMMAMGIASPTK